MGVLLGVALLIAAPDPGCSGEPPSIIRGGPAGGIACCADRSETTAPGETWLYGNVRCEAYGFRIFATELTIASEEGAEPWANEGPVTIEASGNAMAEGPGNRLRGETIILEFERPALAGRLTVLRPQAGWWDSPRLMPLLPEDQD